MIAVVVDMLDRDAAAIAVCETGVIEAVAMCLDIEEDKDVLDVSIARRLTTEVVIGEASATEPCDGEGLELELELVIGAGRTEAPVSSVTVLLCAETMFERDCDAVVVPLITLVPFRLDDDTG